jgi:5-methylcytosine-specific restriction endonuclease McrA
VDKTYYNSTQWKVFREKILTERNFTCEICSIHHPKATQKLEVHHKHYNSVGFEIPKDVLCLCRRCHRLVHKLAKIRGKGVLIERLREIVSPYYIETKH